MYNLYCGKAQVPTIAKITLTKKEKVGGITLTNAKAYGTAKVIKSVWYSWRGRYRSIKQNRGPINRNKQKCPTDF